MKLASKREQPRPAVRTFETPCLWTLQVGDFRGDIGIGEMRVDQRANVRGFRQRGEAVDKPRDQPVSVNARVPVEAAVEDGVKGARALCIGGAAHYVVKLVRVFARQVAKCEPGEFRCQGGVERVMRLIGLRVHAVLQKKPGVRNYGKTLAQGSRE